jgi:hypothetical protein
MRKLLQGLDHVADTGEEAVQADSYGPAFHRRQQSVVSTPRHLSILRRQAEDR